MTDLNEIQFEERNVSSAITWGIISGIFLGLLNYLLQNERLLDSYDSEVPYFGIIVIYLAVTIAITVWVVKIVKKLNRSPLTWGIFAFFFPPITLIVLGFQDYKIKDKYIKGIVDQARLDFNTELLNIKNTQDLTAGQLKEVELKLKEKYSYDLQKKIRESMSDLSDSSDGQEKQTAQEEQVFVDATEEESVQPESGQTWVSDINKCPACGAPLSENASVCPDCGLTIN
jgi:hypothetical protein